MAKQTEVRAPCLRVGGQVRRIIRSLGGGAMGEVYLVENLDRRRLEAFKVMRGEATQNAPLAARFRREGRALERLRHRNVVSVYDHGELADFGLYLAMEYADGPDLEYALATGVRFSLPRCITLLEQLAAAVDHTQECGVIHRDLKPGNVILAQHGADDLIKVMDFGISKIFAADYEGTSATSHGVCFGTPAYMAPEQFGEAFDDPRIDIYALGCIAYELVTGATPFRGTLGQLFRAHAGRAPVRPSEAAPSAGIPAALDAIILRCLEKRPRDRFQRGREIVDALAAMRAPRRRAGTSTPEDADTRVEPRRFATHDGPTLHDTLPEITLEIAAAAGTACNAMLVAAALAIAALAACDAEPPSTGCRESVAAGAVVTAPSCERGDVAAAIEAAQDGDTVAIPAGTCTWSENLTIDGKAITVQGAGMDHTVIIDQVPKLSYGAPVQVLTAAALRSFRPRVRRHAAVHRRRLPVRNVSVSGVGADRA